MAGKTANASTALTDLARYEAKTSPDGRLLHYAKGRIRTFWLRQTLTAFGAVTVVLLEAAPFGLFLAALAVVGEVADILALRWVIGRLEAGQNRWVRAVAVISGGFQALTIAGCVVLCWRLIPLHEARFFAAAFLISAAINAGLTRPLFRPAADVRLAIYALTAFAMLALDFAHQTRAMSREYEYFAAAFAIWVYISVLFIRLLERTQLNRQRHEHAMLKHQRQQELAQNELTHSARNSQRLALVAKYANDSIIISGADGRIEWVNDAFSRIMGFSLAEVAGRQPGDLFNAPGTDPATVAKLIHAKQTQTAVRAEVLNKAKDGRHLWMETSIRPIFDAEGELKLWIAVEREITAAKEREAELARARAAAELAGQSKSQFLANMSHEIRTPMNGVIGVAELLSETALTKTQASYVDTILESGRALLSIINDILDLAKLQSGKAMLEEEPFSPRLCIDSVLRVLRPAADKKGLDLRIADPVPDGMVMGDEGKLRQILLNLVGNAVKFTDRGAVTVTLRLPSATSEFVEVAVADNGIGIAPDRIEAIFESFSQADNGISRQFGGTGLGLTICSMLARQMGGEIAVWSQVGRGSVFTLRARLAVAQVVQAPTPPPERRAAMRLRPGLRVLAAEDNRTNMMIVRSMLRDAVLSLTEVRDGQEAVLAYQAAAPDLVLMDVSMPIKDGLQATRDIRAYELAQGLPRCPMVALTANAFGEDREACRQAGLDGFLVKPLSRADLMAAINTFCPDRNAPPRAMGL